MMKILFCLASAALMLASTTTNATVWHPTNEDTDFIQLDFGGDAGISTNGGILALFDDDTGLTGPALVIGQNGGHVVDQAADVAGQSPGRDFAVGYELYELILATGRIDRRHL